VTGAYGFIGSEVVAALRREGMTVTGCGRDLELARCVNPDIEWIACDFNTDVTRAHWAPRLAGIDVVVNCVGILQGSLRDDAERIHTQATIALFEAAVAAGVRRIVHVSAVSAETDVPTAYARSKAKADAALGKLDMNWLIVKPAVAARERELSDTYRRLSRLWFWLGWPAFLSMLVIFWLMIAKPA
jgi:uncharacterized protein YbjT (DUF2867 family)